MGLAFGLPDRWRYRDTVLTLCTIALFATSVARISFSPLVPAITNTYGVSNTVIGFALSGMWFTYGAVQYPSGLFAQRYGERTIILAAIGGTMFTCLLITIAPLFAVFAAGTVTLGAVAGMHYSVATALLTRTYENVGTAIGIHHLGGGIGGLLGPIGATWVLNQYGWQYAVAGAAGIAAVTFVLFSAYVQPTDMSDSSETANIGSVVSQVFETFRMPAVSFLVCVTILYMFVTQAVISFFPTFLVEFRGRSTGFAGTAFAIFFVTHAVMQTGVGVLADQFDRNQLICGCLVLAIAGFTLLLASGGTAVVIAASALVGIGSCGMTVLVTQLMNQLPDGDRSSGFGLTQTFVMIGGSLGSVSVGVLADHFGWGLSFGVLASLLAIALFVYAFDVTGSKPTSSTARS